MTRYHGFRKILTLYIVFNIIAFAVLYFHASKYDVDALILGGIVTLFLCTTSVVIIVNRLGDEYLFIIISMLISMGTVMIYRLDNNMLGAQIKWIIIGVVLFFSTYIVYLKFYDKWKKYSIIYFSASIFLFLVTLIFGSAAYGAKNWLEVGPFAFQPSEMIKILFVLYLASFASTLKDKAVIVDYENSQYFKPLSQKLGFSGFIEKYIPKKLRIPSHFILMFSVYFMIGFLVLQREWGTALQFFIIYSIMTYVFEKRNVIMYVVIPNIVFAVIGSIVGYYLTPHIKTRVDIWLDPWSEVYGKGFQIARSLFAMASGGFVGQGLYQGYPESIPNATTDFIFPALCEEMGIFGGCAVILLYFILVYRGIKVSLAIRNVFHKKVAFGITVLFGIQTFIIIGGVIKMIPLTGITLPFISYGGSSLTTSFIALGILQAVSNKSYDREGSTK